MTKTNSHSTVRRRVLTTVLLSSCLALWTTTAVAEICTGVHVVGTWKLISNGQVWTFNRDGSIDCNGCDNWAATISGVKKKLGRPIAWSADIPAAIIWSLGGKIDQECNIEASGNIMTWREELTSSDWATFRRMQ